MVDLSAQHQNESRKKARYLSIEKVEEDDASSFCDDDTISTTSWSDDEDDNDELTLNDQLHAYNAKDTRGASSSQTIEYFLQFASGQLGGLNLSLTDQGCCAFRYDGITVVLDVQAQEGAFCLYTRHLVTGVTKPTKDQISFLNSNGYARNGLLSTKNHEDGSEEVIFSYVDLVNEISAQVFLNIIINFVETAATLRSKLLLLQTVEHQQQQQQRSATAVSNKANKTPTTTFFEETIAMKSMSKDKNTSSTPVKGTEVKKQTSGRALVSAEKS